MVLTDIHCHILPGVDDGAESGKVTMELLRQEYKDGIRRIIVTPHYRAGMFEPSLKIVEHRFQKVKEHAARIGKSGIRMYLGCEYYRSITMCEDIGNELRYTMAGTSYILTEFSARDTYRTIRNIVYDLVAREFTPIIAHVERYDALQKDTEDIADLIELGAMIQVNAGSVLGDSGRKIKRFCKKLMDLNYVHFVASDCHDMTNRVPKLGECAAYIEKKRGEEYARQIFQYNPDKILLRGK